MTELDADLPMKGEVRSAATLCEAAGATLDGKMGAGTQLVEPRQK